MASSTPTLSKQRSFGLLEKYQLSKTLIDCYGSVTCTAHLQHAAHRDSNDSAATLSFYLNQFYPAITALVCRYPSLGVNVRDPKDESGHFVHTSCFPLDQIVSIKQVTGTLDETISTACDEKLLLLDQDSNLPLWRLQVLVEPDVFDRCSVIFVAHHVVIDGSSLMYFWQAFLEALNSSSGPSSENWLVTTGDKSLTMAPPMEASPALPKPSYLDYGILAGGIIKDLVLPARLQTFLGLTLDTLWQGDCAAVDGEPHKTVIRLRKIESWQPLMQLAKAKYQVSVHAVLHAAFLMAWSEIYGQPVKVTTPVNCRFLAQVPKGELGNFVGEYQHLWTSETLLNPPSVDPASPLLWRLAAHYHASLQANKQRSPISGQYLGLMKYPKEYVGWWHDKRKKSPMGREGGLEHSDLGRFDCPAAAVGEKAAWKLDGLWFAQSAQTYSTALGLNSITVNNVLYATFGWQRGSVDESKVAKVMDRFVDILQNSTL